MSSDVTTPTNNNRRDSCSSNKITAVTVHNSSSFDIIPNNSNSSSPHNGGYDCENGEDTPIRIPIIGFEVMEERARFTVFKLRVENEKLNETWLVFRRYTDFERLHAKLKEEHPLLLINLPPKRWIRDNFETAFLEDRMKGLQAFVDSILIQHKLTDSAIVREFFCLDEPPLYPENAEESRAMYGSLEESIMHLKDVLNSKETEIQILRAQLALVNTQHENLIKQTKNCRQCGRRSSLQFPSPQRNQENASPVATSTPNFPLTPLRTSNISSRSSQGHNSISSDVNQTSAKLKSTTALINTNSKIIPSEKSNVTPSVTSIPKVNILSSTRTSSSSSSNSDFASASETESTTSSPKSFKEIRQKRIDNNKFPETKSKSLIENS